MTPPAESALLLVLLPLAIATCVYGVSRLLPVIKAAANAYPPWDGPVPDVGTVWDFGGVQRRVIGVTNRPDVAMVWFESEGGVHVPCPLWAWWAYHTPAKKIRVKRWRNP